MRCTNMQREKKRKEGEKSPVVRKRGQHMHLFKKEQDDIFSVRETSHHHNQ